MTNKQIWWEKTVEYSFVLEAADKCEMLLAMPLSGTQEQFGDTVFGTGSKALLVEFKRRHDDLDTEHDKFECYKEAEAKLSGQDAFHFLVYGAMSSSDSEASAFQIEAVTYFGREPVRAPEELFKCAVEWATLNNYLKQLADHKKGDGRSSGKVGPESLASVIGVSTDGKRCGPISLTEYYRLNLPDLYEQLTPTQPHQARPKPR